MRIVLTYSNWLSSLDEYGKYREGDRCAGRLPRPRVTLRMDLSWSTAGDVVVVAVTEVDSDGARVF